MIFFHVFLEFLMYVCILFSACAAALEKIIDIFSILLLEEVGIHFRIMARVSTVVEGIIYLGLLFVGLYLIGESC